MPPKATNNTFKPASKTSTAVSAKPGNKAGTKPAATKPDTKTAANKSSSGKTNGKPATKTTDGKKSTPKTGEKKAQRPKLEQAVGFIHGGELKASRIFAFAVTDGSDVESVKNYVKDNLVTYFGPVLSGRYVKCEDANETLATILDSAGEDRIENCTIIKRNVQNAAILYRDSIGNGVTHTFSLSDEKAKTGKKNNWC